MHEKEEEKRFIAVSQIKNKNKDPSCNIVCYGRLYIKIFSL